MPLVFHENISGNQNLLLWQIVEDEQFLIQLAELIPVELTELEKLVLAKRRKEWLCARLLVDMATPGSALMFLPNGKPILNHSAHISISNSGDLVGVTVSSQTVGLDIQEINIKIKEISGRFCSGYERMVAANSHDELSYLTILWSIKEAIFKCYGENVDFKRHIHVPEFELEDEIIRAEYNGIHGSKSFELRHMIIHKKHILLTL